MPGETNQRGLLSHIVAPSPQDTRSLYWIGVCGVLLNSLRSLHPCFQYGTLLTDPYWVMFYVSNYRDGFRRRALVGSLCRHLFPGGVDIVLINVFALLVLAAAFVLLVRALCRLSMERNTPRTRLVLFALSASTLTAVFYETLGDLLQLTLVMFCLTAMLAAHRLRRESLRLLPLLAVAVLAYFIHEASLFLVLPALPFFLKPRPRLRDFALPACLYLALLALSLHWSNTFPHPSYHASLTGQRILPASAAAAPALHWSLQSEYRSYFASRDAVLYFIGRWPRILALAFAYALALAVCLPRRMAARTLWALGCIVLGSLPLWCIAVDWGRFLSYSLVLAATSSALWHQDLALDGPAAPAPAPAPLVRLAGRLEALSHADLLRFGVLFVLLTGPELPASHVEGIGLPDALGLCLLAGAALLASRTGPAALA